MLGLQAVLEVLGIEIVVFDGVAGPRDAGVLETTDGTHRLQLDIERQAGGNAVGVQLEGVQAFRFDEDLVAVLVRVAAHLVLDGRAVPRPGAFDHAGEHGAAVEPGADDLVGALIGVGNKAAGLARVLFHLAQIAHHRQRLVAPLLFHHREVHGLAVDARRRAGLQTVDAERQLAQPARQGVGGLVAGAAALVVVQAHMDDTAQEGPGGQHHGVGVEAQAHVGHRPHAAAVLDDQVVHALLEQGQVGLALQGGADRRLVAHPVGLGAGGAHRRALAGVEHAELDTAFIGGAGHGPAEGVDFPHQVALADATDGRVAAHLAQSLDIVRQQHGVHAHAGGRQSRFGAGVAATNHQNAESLGVIHSQARSRHAPEGPPLKI